MPYDKIFKVRKNRRRQYTTLNVTSCRFDEDDPVYIQLCIKFHHLGVGRTKEYIDLNMDEVEQLHSTLGAWLAVRKLEEAS